MSMGTGRAQWIISVAAVALCFMSGSGTASAAEPTAAAAPASDRTGEVSPAGEPPQRTVAILVRHAEKATGDPVDPPLSERGVKRAEALAKLLSRAGVTRLFATPYRRTRQTLAPLGTALGMEVLEIDAREPERQVAAIRELPAGSVAVVAGHSNTIPELARLLGGEISGLIEGPGGSMIPDEAHDRMFLLILPASGGAAPIGRAQTLELRYGE